MNGSQHKPGRPKSRQSIAHVPVQSNTTTDIAALKRSIDAQEKSKRTRGKSLGPGGLEALTETSANVFRIPPQYQPKSILKTSVPLTPPKIIPSFDELRHKSSSKAKSPAKNAAEDLLIDFSTPGPSREAGYVGNEANTQEILDPFSPVRLRNSDAGGSQTISHEVSATGLDDEELRRQAEKERRAARRKSLANRRVSFAPEATLHTWSVMELIEDSTTSSAANSTRRQSSMTAAQSPAPQPNTPATISTSDRPSTPVDQPLETPAVELSASQRELHQRKRRRSSDVAHSSDDETFSSAGDDAESSPVRVEESIDSESDTDGDTAMSLDDATANSIRSSESSSTQTSLDERLRLAANQAGTRGIDYDENGSENGGDQTMDIADGTVTHAFKPYARTGNQQNHAAADEKENVNPFHYENDGDEEVIDDDQTSGVTMEMTRAVGGIISKVSPKQPKLATVRTGDDPSRRLSLHGENNIDEESMDLTVAKGYILEEDDDEEQENTDQTEFGEDMTMEMTTAVGGIQQNFKNSHDRLQYMDQTEAMDMTMVAGGILPPIEEQTEPQTQLEDGMTDAMEMTRAFGQILSNQINGSPSAKTPTNNNPSQSPIHHRPTQNLPSSSSTNRQMTTVASETGSPTLQPRPSARRQALESKSTTPRSQPKSVKKSNEEQMTPSKQLTPAPPKSVSAKRTPILTGVTHRGASPKKLFAKEINNRTSPATRKSPQRRQDLLFSKDQTTGLHTPRVVLHAPKPHQHLHGRHSHVNMDEESSGSPRVSEILSRRSSIVDIVPNFRLKSDQDRTIQIDNPREIERQVDLERTEEHRRESGRFIMEQEANEQEIENNTQNLKEMIESMSPKKELIKKIKGRKSLATGSARGLLGKRPAELDLDDENGEGDLTPKRLKTMSRDSSPVKKVHLPKPPRKEETTGKLTRSEVLRLATMAPAIGTPVLNLSPTEKARSPEHTGHFRQPSPEKASSFENRLDNVIDAIDITTAHPNPSSSSEVEEKISLQQFLNMTNIHFIELSTTKRRHTMAIPSAREESVNSTRVSRRSNFVASTTTLPLLDLYQHATRELKSYISSGRQIIRTIEDETFNDQPAIFRAYVDADADTKLFMDNQFRNNKTNARLQSKESWYTWRGQLVDGLQDGLNHILEDMKHDNSILSRQQHDLDGSMPQLVERKTQLEQRLQNLRERVQIFESLDHEALIIKREQLQAISKELEESSNVVDQLQEQMQEKEEVLSQAAELRQEMNDQIQEVVRVQEKQTRWPSKDVSAVKDRVEQLENDYGWKLLTAEEFEDESELGTALTLRYEQELTLFFYPSAFRPGDKSGRRRSGRRSRSVSGPSAPIRLTYTPEEKDEDASVPISTELRFFIQLLQSQLQSYAMLPKNSITCQQVLRTVSEGWALARRVSAEIRQLNTVGIVKVRILNDEQIAAILMLMQPDRSRIDVNFTLTVHSLNDGEFSATTSVIASPIYGAVTTIMDASKTRKVQHALTKETGSRELGEKSWKGAVRGFEEWLQGQASIRSELRASKPTISEMSSLEIDATAAWSASHESAVETRRAATHSPRTANNKIDHTDTSTTPKVPPRSPLAPRTTNRILKKTIPVPKKPVNFSQSQNTAVAPLDTTVSSKMREGLSQKENIIPLTSGEMKSIHDIDVNVAVGDRDDDVFGAAIRPAITPAEQEAMMHTPVKRRVGALRRSPV